MQVEIEKVIKQKKPFKSEFERALVNILYTYGWVTDKQKQFFLPFGITTKQYNILRILRGADSPMTTSQIRDRMLDKMSDTTRLIDRMIKKGWVQKNINDVDRRLVDIVISEGGLSLLREIEVSAESLDEILSDLTVEEARTINRLLDKMRGQE